MFFPLCVSRSAHASYYLMKGRRERHSPVCRVWQNLTRRIWAGPFLAAVQRVQYNLKSRTHACQVKLLWLKYSALQRFWRAKWTFKKKSWMYLPYSVDLPLHRLEKMWLPVDNLNCSTTRAKLNSDSSFTYDTNVFVFQKWPSASKGIEGWKKDERRSF